jgi:hypothetical protein
MMFLPFSLFYFEQKNRAMTLHDSTGKTHRADVMTALRIKRQYAEYSPASQAPDFGKIEPFGGGPFRLTLPCALAKLLMTTAPLSCLVQLY